MFRQESQLSSFPGGGHQRVLWAWLAPSHPPRPPSTIHLQASVRAAPLSGALAFLSAVAFSTGSSRGFPPFPALRSCKPAEPSRLDRVGSCMVWVWEWIYFPLGSRRRCQALVLELIFWALIMLHAQCIPAKVECRSSGPRAPHSETLSRPPALPQAQRGPGSSLDAGS